MQSRAGITLDSLARDGGTNTESSVAAALRARLKAADAQPAELKNQLRERDTVIADTRPYFCRSPSAQRAAAHTRAGCAVVGP